jgi:putative ABC transport system permease protein
MSFTLLSDLRLGARALMRDQRSGELRLLALALIVAVAAVTSVGFLADRVGRALERDSAQMMGGDLVVQSQDPIPASFVQRAVTDGLEATQTLEFPSMVSAKDHAQLVSLKAVGAGYPLRGQLRLADEPAGKGVAVQGAPAPGTVWVDPQVLGLLGIRVGESLELGDVVMRVARIIAYEPDRGMGFINLAPRLMIGQDDLAATGLIAPGSRVRHQLLLAGAPANVLNYRNWLKTALQPGQHLQTLETSRPEMQRAVARAHQFLALVALLTVLIAAVAIALAARRFTLRHQDGIAIMRCLGARRSQLSVMLWTEFLLLALIAAGLGSVLGFVAHLGLVSTVTAWLDASLPPPSWRPAAQGLIAGVLLLVGFAMPPLSALPRISPARVLRRDAALRQSRSWAAYGAGIVAFFFLTLWVSGDARLSVVVTGGFLIAFIVFAAMAGVLLAAVAWIRRHGGGRGRPSLRLALAGMTQRRGLTVVQLCALSMGMMMLLLLGITRSDLLQGWQGALPSDAPNTFLINIQPEQKDEVRARLARAGIRSPALSPMVRGRLVAINDKPVNGLAFSDDRARRMVDRDFNLSYASELPTGNRIVDGQWLDPNASEVSVETGLARTLKLRVGDTMTFETAGRQVEVRVTSLRDVKWDSFQTNFFTVLSPRALAGAPATFITSFYLPPAQAGAPESRLLQDLLRQFPNLTVFDVGSILGQVQQVLDQVIKAVQLLFVFTTLAGVLVLGAAMFATRDERIHEVAIMRALGASRKQLSAALRIELALLGALAGVLAAFTALAIAQMLATHVFDFTMAWSRWPWVVGVVAGTLASLAGGSLALNGVVKSPPLAALRTVV